MNSLLAPFRVVWQSIKIWWDDLINVFVINLIWLACCLTIVLAPPATFGMYHVARHQVQGYVPNPRILYEGARQYFVQSWIWALVNLLVAIIFAANVLFYASFEADWSRYVQGAFIALMFLWSVTQYYAIPYLMIQDHKSLRTAWRNGLLTTLASPWYTIILGLVALLLFILSIAVILPFFLGSGMLLMVLGSQAVEERIRTFKIGVENDALDDEATTENQQEE